jgi:hypothetical protein
VSLSATGEDGAFADFNRASRDISDRIAASRADDALEGILGRPLEACNRLDSPFDDGPPLDPPPRRSTAGTAGISPDIGPRIAPGV